MHHPTNPVSLSIRSLSRHVGLLPTGSSVPNKRAVKQEIAKQGVLPFSLFFAGSYDLSLSRLFGRRKALKTEFGAFSSENTPAAAIMLHWMLTTLIVLGTVLTIKPVPYSSTPAFTFMSVVFTYDIYMAVFICISLGLLCLRIMPQVRWAEKSEFKHPWISIFSASVLFLGALFPYVFMWIPDPNYKTLSRTADLVPWYTTQAFGLGIIGFAFLYWVGLRLYIRIRSAREGKISVVTREPKFKSDNGSLIQVAEIVTLQWVREVGIRIDEIKDGADGVVHDRSWSCAAAHRACPTGPHELPASSLDADEQSAYGCPGGWSSEFPARWICGDGRQLYELPAQPGGMERSLQTDA